MEYPLQQSPIRTGHLLNSPVSGQSVFNGKTAITIQASDMAPRSANGCAALATTNGAADQPDVDYLAFDGAAKEFATFHRRMPGRWNRGAITASFCYRRASGTTLVQVVWGIRAVAVSDSRRIAVNFGADATVTDIMATGAVDELYLSPETGNCTIGSTIAEGDMVFFEVFRDGASADDTLNAVDAWLTEVTVFITTNKLDDR